MRIHHILAAACGLLLAGVASAQTPLLTILTSDDHETQAMALILTRQAAEAGAEARVLLCSDAGDLALEGAPATSPQVRPPEKSPAQMLRGLQSEGVTVEVCAIYLPNRSFSEEDLADGIGVARPDAIGALVGDPEVRLFTF